jgi:hypothetical protein
VALQWHRHATAHLTLLPPHLFLFSLAIPHLQNAIPFGTPSNTPASPSPWPSAAWTAERFPINAPPNFSVPNIRHYRPVLPFPAQPARALTCWLLLKDTTANTRRRRRMTTLQSCFPNSPTFFVILHASLILSCPSGYRKK